MRAPATPRPGRRPMPARLPPFRMGLPAVPDLLLALRPWLAVLLLAAAALAQAPGTRLLQVTVTSAAGRSVYLDRGSSDGLRIGTLVRLLPPAQAPLEVEVRAVSSNSARAEVPAGLPTPPVGTRGEVEVAAEPAAAPAPAPSRPSAPLHPPWQRQEDGRAADQPLLVPAFGQRPFERPMQLSGRAFALGQWNVDDSGPGSSQYFLGRLGTSLQLDNPLGLGGRARFAGEADQRLVQLDDAPDQRDQHGRVDQLSYALGIEEYAPLRAEFGRFYSAAVPELGLLDGVEALVNCEGGLRFGGGLAAYPRPFPARDSGDDVGLHLFADWQSGKDRSFAAAIAVQKTWHRGDADRDLLLLRAEGRPGGGLWLYGSAKVDLYGGGDSIKGSGPELTELLGQARLDGTDAGIGAMLTHFTWPELKRQEYQALPVELVADGRVDRVSLNGWLRPTGGVRLSARADYWQDQDRDGTAGELAADLASVFGPGSSLYLAAFRSDGSFSSGPGARLRARKQLGDVAVSGGYSWQRYELDGLLNGASALVRQSIDVGVDVQLGSCDLNLTFERWFGDAEDSFSLGLYAQWRF